jgi:hypothetical protein
MAPHADVRAILCQVGRLIRRKEKTDSWNKKIGQGVLIRNISLALQDNQFNLLRQNIDYLAREDKPLAEEEKLIGALVAPWHGAVTLIDIHREPYFIVKHGKEVAKCLDLTDSIEGFPLIVQESTAEELTKIIAYSPKELGKFSIDLRQRHSV